MVRGARAMFAPCKSVKPSGCISCTSVRTITLISVGRFLLETSCVWVPRFVVDLVKGRYFCWQLIIDSRAFRNANVRRTFCRLDMNENLDIAPKTLPHKNHACSQRQIHTVHMCKHSQTKNCQRTPIPKQYKQPLLIHPFPTCNCT